MFLKSIRWRIQIWHTLLLTAIVAILLTAYYRHHRDLTLGFIEIELSQFIPPVLKSMDMRLREAGDKPVGYDEPNTDKPKHPRRHREKNYNVSQDGLNPQLDSSPRLKQRREQDFIQHIEMLKENNIYVIGCGPSGPPALITENAPKDRLPPESQNGIRSIFRADGNYYEVVHFTPLGARIIIGQDKKHIEKDLHKMAIQLIAVGCAIVVFGVAIGWFLTGRSLRPIDDISRTARAIAAGKRDKRIDSTGAASELSGMVEVLNETFEQLDKHYENQLRFMADASHEMRTPVAAVLAKAQHALNEASGKDSYEEALKVCVDSARHMRILIDSLLDLARIDSGELELMLRPINITDIAEESLDLLEALAAEKDIEVIRELIPVTATADDYRIRQVIINLLSNAIKYNCRGGTITLTVIPKGGFCKVIISDSGPGISRADLPHVFERFYRSDKVRTKTKEGSTGLGLAITKSIVEAHGGTISVTSDPNVQTTFAIELPI